MGKGYNNYMSKKFFHPASRDNLKRVWMAQQKTEFEKKKQDDMMAQYQREQDSLSNRAILGDEKAKLGLTFMYDPPPGLKKPEDKEAEKGEPKFEWQRKYNAPREEYLKQEEDMILDQPFGIEVRNVRCIKCRKWGHVNTDKICPLFNKDLTAEPTLPGTSRKTLIEGMKEDGLVMKEGFVGKKRRADQSHDLIDSGDEEDPEVQFLKSLTPKQKEKLLRKLDKLSKKEQEGVSKNKKKKKKEKKKKKKAKKHKKREDSSSESSDGSESPGRSTSPDPTRRLHSRYRRSRSPSRSMSPKRKETHKPERSHGMDKSSRYSRSPDAGRTTKRSPAQHSSRHKRPHKYSRSYSRSVSPRYEKKKSYNGMSRQRRSSERNRSPDHNRSDRHHTWHKHNQSPRRSPIQHSRSPKHSHTRHSRSPKRSYNRRSQSPKRNYDKQSRSPRRSYTRRSRSPRRNRSPSYESPRRDTTNRRQSSRYSRSRSGSYDPRHNSKSKNRQRYDSSSGESA